MRTFLVCVCLFKNSHKSSSWRRLVEILLCEFFFFENFFCEKNFCCENFSYVCASVQNSAMTRTRIFHYKQYLETTPCYTMYNI